MKTALDKKYRIAGIVAGLLLLVLSVFQLFYSGYGNIRVSSVIGILPCLVCGILLLTGALNRPAAAKTAAAVFAVSAVYKGFFLIRFIINGISLFGAAWVVQDIAYTVVLLTGSAVAALTLAGCISWKKRSHLLAFLYIYLIIGLITCLMSAGRSYNVLNVMFVLCLFPQNLEEGCRKGTAGRCGLYLFPLAVLPVAAAAIFSEFIYQTAHIFEEEASDAFAQAHSMYMLAVIPWLITWFLFPLMLFDKRFPVTASEAYETEISDFTEHNES